MPPTLILVVTALLALCAGFTAGWLLGVRRRSKRAVIKDLETRLERALENRADYEAEVAEHFATTAQLLNRMTEDYRSVYSHLAGGAEKLCDGAVNIPRTGIGAPVQDSAEIPPQMVDVMQPLDYAPRKDPREQGQLSETFGLEKTPEDIEAEKQPQV